jgi:hypothetical protein
MIVRPYKPPFDFQQIENWCKDTQKKQILKCKNEFFIHFFIKQEADCLACEKLSLKKVKSRKGERIAGMRI